MTRSAVCLSRLVSLLLVAAGEARPQAHFLRGDANHDRKIDLSDPVATLHFLFTGGDPPPCRTWDDPPGDEPPGCRNISETLARHATNIIAESSPTADPHNEAAPDFRPRNDALTAPFDPTQWPPRFEPAPYRVGLG